MTAPVYADDDVVLFHADCLEVLAMLADDSIDSVVCDPPYGLEFMGKEWDSFDKKERRVKGTGGTQAPFANHAASLDRARGKAFQRWCETWASECLRVLKPGGHLVAFGGTRTYHRMTCAIEDAGFEVRDSLHWIYGCLSADTEILTEQGWKLGIEVEVGEPVAQWDVTTGQISLVPVQRTFRAPWDGPMRVLRNSDTDQLLTPNHRVYHEPRQRQMTDGVRRTWYDEQWQVAEAESLSTWNPVRLPVSGEHDGPGIGGEDYAALLGWVWTEGSFAKSGTGIYIYQSSVNSDKVSEISALLDRIGSHKRYDDERTYTRRNGQVHPYTLTTWFFSGDLARRVRSDLPGKRPTYGLLWRMSLLEKQAILRAAMLGDGSGWGTKGEQFYQKQEDDLIWLQTLLALIGRSGEVGMRPNRPGGAVYLRRTNRTELQARHLRNAWENYAGEVWCVSVPMGAFVARRNGHVFITGNSGFPKGLDVSKAIDKAAGAEREVVGKGINYDAKVKHGGTWTGGVYAQDPYAGVDGPVITAPATDEAKQWSGWNVALKPGHEPIVLARKPLSEKTVVANVLKHGTGAMNIDGCRIEGADAQEGRLRHGGGSAVSGSMSGPLNPDVRPASPAGRWPPNILLTHSAACVPAGEKKVRNASGSIKGDEPSAVTDAVYAERERVPWQAHGDADGMETVAAWTCADDCPVAEMDRQSGQSKSVRSAGRQTPKQGTSSYGDYAGTQNEAGHEDVGGASRFFPQFEWSPEYDFPYLYCAKAPKKERPVVFAKVMRLREGLTDEQHAYVLDELRKAGVVVD